MVGETLKYQLEKLLKFDIPLNNLVGFEEQCQDIIKTYEDISNALVIDLNGKILFHSSANKIGQVIAHQDIIHLLKNKKPTLHECVVEGETFYSIAIPVVGQHQELLAAVIIDFPKNLISRKVTRMVAYSAGVALVILSLGVFSLIMLMKLWVTNPLGQLLQATEEIRSTGTDRVQLVNIKSKDEIGKLSVAFNEMVLQLRASQAQIRNYTKELEYKVAESTAYLKEVNEQLKQDIQERMKAEAALKKSEEKYRALLNHAGDGILLLDAQGRLLEANEKMEEMLGYPIDQLLRLNFIDLHPAGNRAKARENLARVVNQGFISITDDCLVRQNGLKIPVDITANRVEFGGQRIIQGIFRDISERLKVEEERLKVSKLESIGILAGGIAHDFNNHLTGILGCLDLALLDPALPEEARERLTKAEKAVGRSQELSRLLLTFAKGGAPIKKRTQIDQLLRESASFTLSGSTVRCQFYFPADLWNVEIDAAQVSQLISNLLINADQAMPQGGAITIRAENVTVSGEVDLPLEAGNYTKITITDQGLGIPPENLAKIFDPYFTTKKNGSGLGLATVYSIVKGHGGCIRVESALGRGSTFELYFPASTAAEAPPERRVAGIIPGEGHILVMDDEPLVREVLKRMLEKIGYQVNCAADGAEAVELYKQAKERGLPYAALISDLTIPGGMGGVDTINILRQFDPQIKAIVSSGYSDDPVMANYREFGFQGVLVKPYKIEQLSQAIHELTTKDSAPKPL